MLTARAFAAKRHESIDSGQEFLALGVANVAAGLFHGFPVSSSGSRTALGDAMGSRTQLHSLVAMVSVLLTMLFLGPLLAVFPRAALGAVVIYAATRLVDIAELAADRPLPAQRVRAGPRHHRRGADPRGARRHRASRSRCPSSICSGGSPSRTTGSSGTCPGMAGMHDVEDYPAGRQVPGLVVYRYDSPLFFANAEDFKARALLAVDEAHRTRSSGSC